jgi:hypothetical protein
MDERVRKFRGHIARLHVAARMLDEIGYSSISKSYRTNFEDIINQISTTLGDNLSFLSGDIGYSGSDVDTTVLKVRVRQAIAYLNEAYAKELGLEQVNVTLDSLKDPILKERCTDLLRAHDHYDRAVNQATLVLEDRLRRKSDQSQGLTGASLVNALIKVDRENSPLVLSSDDSEQRGFADIIRGIMAAHRNPTHHTIYSISQLDAARICAYIDVVLEIVEGAQLSTTVRPSRKT